MVELEKQNYDANILLYKNIESQLKEKLGINTTISHVGSTAIPNMVGKNIIDVLVGAKDFEQFNRYATILMTIGFFPSLKSKTENYQFFASKETETGSGDIHIHLAIIGTTRYNEFILLRDFLLNNPKEAKAYSEFKKKILIEYGAERQTYRAIKSEYVSNLLKKIKKIYHI